jgi:predicted aconitase
MEILTALGTIYAAERMVPVTSVQIAGVSFDNLGEAGLDFLSEMAAGGGQVRVLTTLNPAGMDIENWQALGIDPDFARNQERVIDAYAKMGVLTTCSCTISSVTCRTLGKLPGRRAARCATPTPSSARARIERAVPAPWPPR